MRGKSYLLTEPVRRLCNCLLRPAPDPCSHELLKPVWQGDGAREAGELNSLIDKSARCKVQMNAQVARFDGIDDVPLN